MRPLFYGAMQALAALCCFLDAAHTSQALPGGHGAAVAKGKTRVGNEDNHIDHRSGTRNDTSHGSRRTDDRALLNLILEAESRYVLGFPSIVSVTYDNPSSIRTYTALPALSLTFTHGSVGLRLEPVGEGAPTELAPEPTESMAEDVRLNPNEQRQMLLDLSNLRVRILPGKYKLSLVLSQADWSVTSNAVVVELVGPSPEEEKESRRLRQLGRPSPANAKWAPFLTNNGNVVIPADGLSADARRQLALHLFLRQAFYGPQPVAGLDEAPLRRITDRTLRAEVAALGYEISAARTKTDTQRLRSEFLAQWPAMRYRVEAREGLLAAGRKLYGAETD